ncbi:unnamed protein product [Brachionus calyciflorus]|uniref:Uncharacterized protein n=1 Tax=Brachionus calyciflorus TaxID=104777 RepID=A0A814IBH1_9BILA|nr:unnamed protein product [Brachionus calyciflorus]
MNSRNRSQQSSASETESVTDISCAESIPQQAQQRFILSPNMYYQDTIYRTYSYAQPVVKNFPPVMQQDISNTISTCVRPDGASYRYRYYAPAGPVPASRLIKGEAAPKRFGPIEPSMSFQNLRMYPPSRSYDGSCRNINFDPMFDTRHVEQYNRPVSNMWQIQGSSANTTNSSQKFLNQYPVEPTLNQPGNNYFFQDKNNLFNKVYQETSPTKIKNNLKLKVFGIIGLVFLIIISIAVVLSVLFTRNSFSARSLSKVEQVVSVNSSNLNLTYESLISPRNVSVPIVNLTTVLSFNLTTQIIPVVENNSTVLLSFLNETVNSTVENPNLGNVTENAINSTVESTMGATLEEIASIKTETTTTTTTTKEIVNTTTNQITTIETSLATELETKVVLNSTEIVSVIARNESLINSS